MRKKKIRKRLSKILNERDDLYFFLDRILEIMDLHQKLKNQSKGKEDEEINKFYLQKNLNLILNFFCDYYFTKYPDKDIKPNEYLVREWKKVVHGVRPFYEQSVKKIIDKYRSSYVT